ncbi:tRNA-specific adenosine deaminase 1, partial [Dispira simplex]
MATDEALRWANQVAQACLTQFQSLPKKGKPTMQEGKPSAWTVLAGVVLETPDGQFHCVALGTGLKCLPESRLTSDGNVLHDAHAEVVARRGFLRYLYHQVQQTLGTQSSAQSIFVVQESSVKDQSRHLLKLRSPAYKFHFYTSKIPCGDASMVKITQYDPPDTAKGPTKLRPNEQGPAHQTTLRNIEPVIKKRRMTNQVNHCLPFCRGRDNPHCLAALRTKPARKDAERTTSMSCSDKLMIWNVVGIQSALLSLFIEPIFLASVIIGEPFNHDAVAAALGGRLTPLLDATAPVRLHHPELVRATVEFPFQEPVGEGSASVLLSDSAIGWYYGSSGSE